VENGRTTIERKLEQLSEWVLRHPRGILVSYIVISLVLAFGVTRVKADTDPRKNIGLKIPYVNDLFEVCQTELGSLYSYDLSITFDAPGMAKDPKVLQNLDLLEGEVEQYPLTKRTNSVVTVIKDMNQVMHEDDPGHYQLPDSREMIAQLFLLYENAGGTEAEYWVDYDYQRLRLQVQLDDFAAKEARNSDRLSDHCRNYDDRIRECKDRFDRPHPECHSCTCYRRTDGFARHPAGFINGYHHADDPGTRS
jgi:predicted RND superfamily exporter protein